MMLALDPATQMGWASKEGKRIRSGTLSFHNNQWDGAGMRYLKFRKWLVEHRPEIVGYESVEGHTSTYAGHVYGGWIAVLQSYCEAERIPYVGFPVGTIKKFWTGKGNASKKEMISACNLKGFDPADDNEADALAILHLLDHEYGGLL